MSLPANIITTVEIICPKCGAIKNIGIAGIKEFPRSPQSWFCRCMNCGKSFFPRLKAGSNSEKRKVSNCTERGTRGE